MKRFLLVICLAIISITFSTICSASEYEQKIEKFVSMLKAGKSAEAVDYIYSGNPWLARAADAVQNVKSQVVSLNKLVGNLKNHEKLQEVTAGGRFVHLTYLAAYERQPIRFRFEFYKPENTWIIFSFSLDDKLDDDLEAAANAKLGR